VEALAGTLSAHNVAKTLWANATMGREPGVAVGTGVCVCPSLRSWASKVMVAFGDHGQGCVLQCSPSAPGSSVLCGLQCGVGASYRGDQRIDIGADVWGESNIMTGVD